ncbi:MOSC domain-containing protein [Hymenobacter cellulosivorans]|uniref:MOSC domain-containing protein n=1 Tax=Hymenobacter cellulosivorans TaxID=2932249 RepID=A0ABY4FFN4_9BACT|nr:MOSC N-terminal beta barrel domain-containing protein [Hymenobacter cellulosivorans]UOQ55350.1 MOSC domain-containing protein [Hymenobacter cellulosivorans]
MTAASLVLSDIYIYPVKSLGGIRVTEATVEPRGLRHDRRWLIVDERNQFMTQRQTSEMALLKVLPAYNGFLITHSARPEMLPLYVPFEATPERTLFVTIWDDMVFAWRGTPEADAWVSEALGRSCKLVYMSDMVMRPTDDGEVPGNVSFADAYPFLLVGQASLDELNSRLPEALPMNRFRPNLVFGGGQPYEEESWRNFRIGELLFEGIRPCGRCAVTTIDQQTAQKSAEPLRTMAPYRTQGGKVMFGQNVTGPGSGTLRLGDTLVVQSTLA